MVNLLSIMLVTRRGLVLWCTNSAQLLTHATLYTALPRSIFTNK